MSRKMVSARCRMQQVSATAGVFLAITLSSSAQSLASDAAPRVLEPIRESALVTLRGNTLPVAAPRNDLGRVADSTPTGRVLLALKHSPEQQAALDKLVADQQNPASPNFHKWLKTADYARQFGVDDADIQSVTGYLSAEGFNVARVFPNKMAIEFSGTAGQLRSTFHTEIHTYQTNGQKFTANDRDPQIPSALASVVSGFASLNNYQPKANATPIKKTGPVKTAALKNGPQPMYTDSNANELNVAPGDIAQIYNIPSNATGTGVTVGILGNSNVNLAYVADYQTTFGLTLRYPTVIVDGDDPGETPNEFDALGQIELVAATAPGAFINYYTSASDDASSGINFAVIRAVDDDAAQVLVYGYESCEANLGTSGNGFNNALAEQAAAEGMTVIAGAGDGGSASCDSSIGYGGPGLETQAMHGLAVNGYASTPFVTAVGATDFYYGKNPTEQKVLQYWNENNGGSAGYTSAKGYIPEQTWNYSDSSVDTQNNLNYVVASGGGVSTLGDEDSNGNAIPYPTPSWQLPVLPAGLAASGARVVPDVSIFGGNGLNGSAYIVCAQADECVGGSPSNLNYELAGGTSVASATFAGITALVVQSHGAQGNINPTLYSMFKADGASVFHAPQAGTNTVPCASGTPNCGSSGYLVDSTGAPAYQVTSGYNAAGGLGSVNVTNLINDWASPQTTATTTTFSITSPGTSTPLTTFVHGTEIQANIAVTSAGGTPTGDVAVIAHTPLSNNTVPIAETLTNGTITDTYYLDGLVGGTYQIQARYAGGGVYAPSLSTPFTVSISPEASTLEVYNSSFTSGASVTYGTSISIGLLVISSANRNSIGQPTGAITVLDNGQQLTVVPIDATSLATFTAKLDVGSHALTFSYPGDASYKASSNTTGLNVTVTAQGTTTSLSTSSSTVSRSGFAQLVAVVDSSAGAATGVGPTGTVAFKTTGTNAQTLGTATLVPGTASNGTLAGVANFQLTGNKLTAGSQSIIAVYTPASGAGFSASTSAGLPVTINPSTPVLATTTTIATSDGASSYFDYTGSISFNVSVAASSGSGATPTGTVALFANGNSLGSATLSSGSAVLTINADPNTGNLPAPFTLGEDVITAQYSGDSTYGTSTRVLPITILDEGTLPDFTLQTNFTYGTLTSSSSSANYILQLSSINNYAGLGRQITFIAAVPTGLSCSFTNKTAKFTTTAEYLTNTLTCSAASGYTIAQVNPALPVGRFWIASGGVTFACVFLFGLPARRRQWQRMLGLAVLAVFSLGIIGGMTACSSMSSAAAIQGSSLAAAENKRAASPAASMTLAPGTYQVLVTAVGAFGAGAQANTTTTQAHTIPVQVVVQ